MRRKGLLVGAWLLATLAATLIAWAAVRQVTAEVSPRGTLPFPSAVAIAGTDPPTPAEQQPPTLEEAVESEPVEQAPVEPEPVEQGEGRPEEAAQDGGSVTQAYNLVGGVVTVRYRNATTSLLGATPNSGFQAEVKDGGPGKVDVRFRSDRHESRLVARWDDGAADVERQERPR